MCSVRGWSAMSHKYISKLAWTTSPPMLLFVKFSCFLMMLQGPHPHLNKDLTNMIKGGGGAIFFSQTPLSAQISASKYQNLSQSPLKTMIPWSNLRKITKRSFSDTLKLCNPSDAILEVNTVTQLSDQIFVQKWLRTKLLQFLDWLDWPNCSS